MASRDPFSSIPDVAAYLPRPATERALGLLAAAVEEGDRPVVLEGPAGIGKTLLLHLLALRSGSQLRAVSVPIPTLSPDELWHWVVESLGVVAGEDALTVLARSVGSGLPVLLLIDDANSLPPETVRALVAALDSLKPALRAVLVASDDEETNADLLLEIGGPVARIRFSEPMTSDESAAYVRKRLDAAGVDAATCARFDDATLSLLHRHAKGVPAAVHELADVMLRPDEAARAHELAAELRPDIVASAAARRASESIERVAEWGDEDLAMTVAQRSKGPAAPPARVAAPPKPQPLAPGSSADVARPRPARASEVSRPVSPQPASSGAATSIVAPLALALLLASLLAVAAVWHFDLLGPPKPTHTATFIEETGEPGATSRSADAETGDEAASVREGEVDSAEGAAPLALQTDAASSAAIDARGDVPGESESTSAAATGDAAEASLGPASDAAGRLVEDIEAVPIAMPTGSSVSASEAGARPAAEAGRAVAPAPTPELSAAARPGPAAEPEVEIAAAPAPPGRAEPAVMPEGDAEAGAAVTAEPALSAELEPTVETIAVADLEPEPELRAAAERARVRQAAPRPAPALAGQLPPSTIAVTRPARTTYLATVIAPVGTRVEIDDDVRGTAPLAAVALSEGDHRVRWIGPDGAVTERVFRIDAEHRTLDLIGASSADEP